MWTGRLARNYVLSAVRHAQFLCAVHGKHGFAVMLADESIFLYALRILVAPCQEKNKIKYTWSADRVFCRWRVRDLTSGPQPVGPVQEYKQTGGQWFTESYRIRNGIDAVRPSEGFRLGNLHTFDMHTYGEPEFERGNKRKKREEKKKKHEKSRVTSGFRYWWSLEPYGRTRGGPPGKPTRTRNTERKFNNNTS